MSRYYHTITALISSEPVHRRPDGSPRQEIELVLADDPDKPSWRMLEPAICALDAHQARELAFELLMLAEVAEQWERAR